MIIDLDQTLISCNQKVRGDFSIEFCFRGKNLKAEITVRPFAVQFLSNIRNHFEVILFSSSHRLYVDSVLKTLDPNQQLFDHVITKSKCLKLEKHIVKPIGAINRNISKTLIVDDNLASFACNLENGIPIIPFFGNKDDIELIILEQYLMFLR